MQKELEIAVLPAHISYGDYILKEVSNRLNLPLKRLKYIKILKRSIDARGKQVVYRVKVKVFIDEVPIREQFTATYANIADKAPVLIVGAGPAGLFAALQCIENGLKPIVLERGKPVRDRRRDLARLNKEGLVDPNSNYCFGEGGAGTYSDGKLYTRSNKRGDVQKVLELLVAHGATEDILIDARPHIGTNKLPHIIENIRRTIIDHGGEIHFNSRIVDIVVRDGAVKGVELADKTPIDAEHIILATGHSARDIFYLFDRKKWLLEAKPFALGVRIEHPQAIIDRAQYHCESRHENLPPAYYSVVEQVENRGVFSFCMCPGGVIAPCATAAQEIVVNGWSPSKRNNPYANSGTVVEVRLEDVPSSSLDPLALLQFQQDVEAKAFELAGGKLRAPGQRMVDFVEDRISADLPENSYRPGVSSVSLKDVLPGFVTRSLQRALPVFGQKMKGYYTNEALLVGVESRTSSPIRIPRDKDTLQHPQIKGLYPCGEGAGYAGGIVSAAIDGMNCAVKIA